MEPSFSSRVYDIVKRIPLGKVLTYGDVAFLARSPRASRIVGALMAKVSEGEDIPCHRVVYGDGSLCSGRVFGGEGVQRALLEAEGVGFLSDGKVDLKKYIMDI